MSVAGRFDKLTPREQRLLGLLAAVAGIMLFVGVPGYLYLDVAEAREENTRIRKLLARMNRSADDLARLRAKKEAIMLRYAKPAPALRSFIESVARANGLEVPEASDLPPIEGKGYRERVTKVRMRKVSLKPLMLMLQAIERSGHPVAITGLRITKRASGPDLFDVSLAVSAYDKDDNSSPDDKGKKGKKRKKGSK